MLPRSLFALLLVSLSLVASPGHARAGIPAITSPVTDYANALSSEDKAVIEKKLVALRERTGVQMAALVITTLNGVPIDDFAQEVFMAWGGAPVTATTACCSCSPSRTARTGCTSATASSP